MSDLRTARDLMETTVPESPALVVDADTPLTQVLDYLAPTLYDQPDLPGVAVRDGDQMVGLITRQRLLNLAADSAIRKSVELAGISISRARYFVCREGDYEELVIFYDPNDPPTCPNHKIPLQEEH